MDEREYGLQKDKHDSLLWVKRKLQTSAGHGEGIYSSVCDSITNYYSKSRERKNQIANDCIPSLVLLYQFYLF